MGRYCIYALKDERLGDGNEAIRYIGKTSVGVTKRVSVHLKPTELNAETHKNHWLRDLLAAGLQPHPVVLEVLPDHSRLSERERYWIRCGRELGWPLTNGTDGGDGSPVGRCLTALAPRCSR